MVLSKKMYAYILLTVLFVSFSGFAILQFFQSQQSGFVSQNSIAGNISNSVTGNVSLSHDSHDSHHNQISLPKEISFNEAVGKKAPLFELSDLQENIIKLSDYYGKNVVLFFNEGSMCYPGCWNQIEALADDERFNNEETVSFSIVVDPKSEWVKITEQIKALGNAKLLFDETKAVSAAYDMLDVPSSMHKGSFPGHSYVIIDKQGIIRYVFDDPQMGIRNDQLSQELEKL